VAAELHRLREAPVDGRALQVVARVDVERITGPERADLLRLAARVAVWAGQRRDEVAVTLADGVPAVTMVDDPDGRELVPEPGAEEVAVALHCSPGSARWQLRETRARGLRAPALTVALRAGDSGPGQARALEQACQGLPDTGAVQVAARCHRVLLSGTRQQVIRVARRHATAWQLAHPEPVPDTGAADPAGRDPRDQRSVDAFGSSIPGMVAICALLAADDAAALMARLEAAAATARAAGDPRTRDQIAADTLAAFGWAGLPHEDLLGACQVFCVRAAAVLIILL